MPISLKLTHWFFFIKLWIHKKMATEHYRGEMHRWGGPKDTKYIQSATYLETVWKIPLNYTTIWSYFVLVQWLLKDKIPPPAFLFFPCNQVVLALLYCLISFHHWLQLSQAVKRTLKCFTKKHQKGRLDEIGKSILPTTFLLKSRLDFKFTVSTQ